MVGLTIDFIQASSGCSPEGLPPSPEDLIAERRASRPKTAVSAKRQNSAGKQRRVKSAGIMRGTPISERPKLEVRSDEDFLDSENEDKVERKIMKQRKNSANSRATVANTDLVSRQESKT